MISSIFPTDAVSQATHAPRAQQASQARQAGEAGCDATFFLHVAYRLVGIILREPEAQRDV
ncbi:MAG TPA: hypothetical protein VFB50_17885 [Chloroflexota bacterium]|nr:hypothetical protein [Chloroflexota bacterium]